MTIQRSSLCGSLRAPPSKSYTHRALFCSALARGESELHSPLSCDDTLATSQALSKIGVTTVWSGGTACVTRSGELRKASDVVFCGESGTTLRFITAVCATTPHDADISGEPSLLKRPVKDLAVALRKLGANCTTNQGYPPVHVRGPIKGGSVTIPGNVSSQYVSALLLAAPLAEMPVEIDVSGCLESRSYVQMTLDMQNKFGVRVDATDDLTTFRTTEQTYYPSQVQIEGDWSSAAFLLVGATIAGERVRVLGLAEENLQADRSLIRILRQMNGRVMQDSDSVAVEKSQLEPVEVDVSNCPDLFPAVCALCATADGVSTLTGIRRLRIKESNRVQAMSNGLRQMGIETKESENALIIHGGRLRKAILNPYGDHRIAMAFAALALCTDEATIHDGECVAKSYPSFWSDLESLGARVTAG